MSQGKDGAAAGIKRAVRQSASRLLHGQTRLVVISSPRSGNTWLRHLLASLYVADNRAVHTLDDVDWEQLPPRYVLQIHCHAEENALSLFAEYGFRVVSLCRQPLAVLISILHFAPRHPECKLWLAGQGGDESSILGVLPRSRAFLKYATGARAKALLSVSPQWWSREDSLKVRYEDLVADAPATLRQLCSELGATPLRSVNDVAGTVSFRMLRGAVRNQHFWRGNPDVWRSLLCKREALLIAQAHHGLFETLGYRCEPDEGLEPEQANTNWYNLEFASAWDQINDLLDVTQTHQNDLEELRRRVTWLERKLGIRRPSGNRAGDQTARWSQWLKQVWRRHSGRAGDRAA